MRLLYSRLILDQKATPSPPAGGEAGTGQPETCSETGFAILDRKVVKKRDEG